MLIPLQAQSAKQEAPFLQVGEDVTDGLKLLICFILLLPITSATEATEFTPSSSIVDNIVGDSRTFSISTNQTINVTWYINNNSVQNNISVFKSNYTNVSAGFGIWNVTVIGIGTNENMNILKEWVWNITMDTIPPSIIAPPDIIEEAGGIQNLLPEIDNVNSVYKLLDGQELIITPSCKNGALQLDNYTQYWNNVSWIYNPTVIDGGSIKNMVFSCGSSTSTTKVITFHNYNNFNIIKSNILDTTPIKDGYKYDNAWGLPYDGNIINDTRYTLVNMISVNYPSSNGYSSLTSTYTSDISDFTKWKYKGASYFDMGDINEGNSIIKINNISYIYYSTLKDNTNYYKIMCKYNPDMSNITNWNLCDTNLNIDYTALFANPDIFYNPISKQYTIILDSVGQYQYFTSQTGLPNSWIFKGAIFQPISGDLDGWMDIGDKHIIYNHNDIFEMSYVASSNIQHFRSALSEDGITWYRDNIQSIPQLDVLFGAVAAPSFYDDYPRKFYLTYETLNSPAGAIWIAYFNYPTEHNLSKKINNVSQPLTNVVLGSPVVTDLIDTSPQVTNNAPLSGFPLGNTTVTWSAMDISGNLATATQIVSIQDTRAPTIIDIKLNTISPQVNTNILVSVKASDFIGVSKVNANGIPFIYQGNNIWTGSISALQGVQNITVNVIDKAGNLAVHTVSYNGLNPIIYQSSGGGGGGGGGAASSPEAYNNIARMGKAELFWSAGKQAVHVYKDLDISSVAIVPSKSVGYIEVRAEELKQKSNLTKTEPPTESGKVYKYYNIWLGTTGMASVQSAEIKFKAPLIDGKVTNAVMMRYDDKTQAWEPLDTALVSSDAQFAYYSAKTAKFSPFVIIYGLPMGGGAPVTLDTVAETMVTPPVSTPTSTPENTPAAQAPGFGALLAIVGLLAVAYLSRKAK